MGFGKTSLYISFCIVIERGDDTEKYNTCNSRRNKYTEPLLCLSFSFCFHFFLSSQKTSEDDFLGDEWLSFTFLGVMETR